MSALRGVIPAVPTPVAADGRPDTARLVTFVRDLLDVGCDAVNLLGTTGEATSFDRSTRLEVMQAVAAAGLAPRMLVGTGAAALADAAALTRAADRLGFAGALLLPPFYYTDIGDNALATYVETLIEQVRPESARLYLYNFPQLTGIRYTLEVVERLSRSLGSLLAGIKDSSGDLAYAKAMASTFGELAVFPSDEATLLDARQNGFAGCISASVNVFPELACTTHARGPDTAPEVYDAMVAVRKALTSVPLVPAVKAAVAWRRQDDVWKATTPPLLPLDRDQLTRLHAGLQAAHSDGP
jgi:4-hydroxy-tetrahydrodipicolinate synthase